MILCIFLNDYHENCKKNYQSPNHKSKSYYIMENNYSSDYGKRYLEVAGHSCPTGRE